MSIYQKQENLNMVLAGAKAIGVQLVNIGGQDIIAGRYATHDCILLYTCSYTHMHTHSLNHICYPTPYIQTNTNPRPPLANN